MLESLSPNSRSRFLASAVLIIMAVFVVRLFYLQIIQHDHYSRLANSEQMRQWKLTAERGEVYAMNGDQPVRLVLNEAVYTVWADPKTVEDPGKTMDVLTRVAGGNLRSNARELLAKTDTRYQVLAKKVTYKQAQLIKKEKLYGIGFERTDQRVYPEGNLASQVLGFVNDENKGQYGVEAGLDNELAGKDGLIKTVADVRDVPLTIGNDNINIPAQNGKDVVLTIDRNIQLKAQDVLAAGLKRSGASEASMLVMDPSNGHVLAMANLPTYDPSALSTVKDVSLFNNNIISDPYEPGSVIKSFTVSTGIDRGAISPSSTFVNTDKIQIDDATIGNASLGHTGTKSMQYALDWSLNTGMVTIAQRIGGGSINPAARQIIYDYYANRFRLNKPTGIELANEVSGTLISPDTAEGNAVRYATMTFGQGMSSNMLQVSTGFSAIVNGGTYIEPTIVAGEMKDDKLVPRAKKKSNRVLSAQTATSAREMIHQAHYATYRPQKERSGFYIGGKTGTSQTIDPATGKYTNDETIATYLGFGGENNAVPRYVIMVRVAGKNGAFGGGTDAKPVFLDMSNWMIDYLKLQPKG